MDAELAQLSANVGAWLAARGLTLATAESCTGGWVGQVVTMTPGSSAWFERGFVTYTDRAKQELLGVREATLVEYGAVSEETVREMVEGALAASPADVALAISGIAGPDGGSAAKPVGTVCLAWGVRGATPTVARLKFDGDRDAVRRAAVVCALTRLIDPATLPALRQ